MRTLLIYAMIWCLILGFDLQPTGKWSIQYLALMFGVYGLSALIDYALPKNKKETK